MSASSSAFFCIECNATQGVQRNISAFGKALVGLFALALVGAVGSYITDLDRQWNARWLPLALVVSGALVLALALSWGRPRICAKCGRPSLVASDRVVR